MSEPITSIWLWLAVDPDDGTEGIVAIQGKDGWHPAVADTEARALAVRPVIVDMVRTLGATIRLARFDVRTDIETIGGN